MHIDVNPEFNPYFALFFIHHGVAFLTIGKGTVASERELFSAVTPVFFAFMFHILLPPCLFIFLCMCVIT